MTVERKPTEAKIVETEHGKQAEGDGWFILNVAEATWFEHDQFGTFARIEGEDRFPHVGVNVHVLRPGEPGCRYHREDKQEGFLVLAGACEVIVCEERRPLKQWDYFHCPPGVDHVLVGAGDGPCALLMLGARGDAKITYPVSAEAAKNGASVKVETDEPKEAYADVDRPRPRTGPDFPFA